MTDLVHDRQPGDAEEHGYRRNPEEEQQYSGAEHLHQEGKVVALGTGKRDDDGKVIPFEVKKGDRVLISKYGGTEIKIEGDDYLIMREDDILGVIG